MDSDLYPRIKTIIMESAVIQIQPEPDESYYRKLKRNQFNMVSCGDISLNEAIRVLEQYKHGPSIIRFLHKRKHSQG